MRILLASVDRDIRKHLRRGLEADHHIIDLAADGETAIEHVTMTRFHCAIVDDRLADMSALEYLRRVPSIPHVPTIVIGRDERGAPAALDLGADDYLPRPFHLAELKARVCALARRWNGFATDQIAMGAYHFDLDRRMLFRGGEALMMPPRPTAILEALALANGESLSKEQLLVLCWGGATEVEVKIVDVLLCRIRKVAPDLVTTIWGRGYCINCNAGLASAQIVGEAA